MITVYTFTYNEQYKILKFILFYRKRFPGCRIVVFDNISTDRTVAIANRNDCEVIRWSTGGYMDDVEMQHIKNTCWKASLTDWNIVCDIDELLDVYPKDLVGCNIIRSMEVYMFEDGMGVPYSVSTSKKLCFHKEIGNINYGIGAHFCSPEFARYSEQIFLEYHYHFKTHKQYRELSKRLPAISKVNGYSMHYSFSRLRVWWNERKHRNKSIQIR